MSGDERAWGVLIGRYKSLIFSFPRRYGAGPFDSADVFQLVCAELFLVLPRLRNHESLRSWIATVAAHQAYRWKRRMVHRARREGDDQHGAAEAAIAPSNTFEQAERDRVVRAAIAQLPPRDRELVRMLFYEDPPIPYQTVADRLGVAIGSVGVVRLRCLKRLARILEQTGMRN